VLCAVAYVRTRAGGRSLRRSTRRYSRPH